MQVHKQHWYIAIFAIAVASALTVQQHYFQASTLRLDPNVIRASCTPIDQRYANLFFGDLKIENWPDEYHNTVEKILEEYSQPPKKIQCLEQQLFPVENTTLYELAAKLPPWQNGDALADLQRNDVGFVLLEFLRIYECAMLDRKNFTTLYVQNRYATDQDEGVVPANQDLRLGVQNTRAQAERKIIEEELAVARPTMEKALALIAGNNRLSVLDAELQCLQRASLDIRNGLGLVADTSSCLPRIWNAKDVLRKL